ncbi:hypothetical protein QUF74_15405 [Candidatus Halobeggiatoa sp. HSG11]|nr:hypothetical protein [Candidatus Halobeggiatoa sp. HSG11]
MKYILRFINWIFVIGLLFVGTVLSNTLFFAGISLIFAALLISPYIQDFLRKFFKVNYLISVRFIIILTAILTAIVSLQYEKEENLFTAKFLLFQFYFGEDIEGMNRVIKKEAENRRKQEYLTVREDIRAELKYLYDDTQYHEVIMQSASYVSFDAHIKKLYKDAEEKLKQEQIKTILDIVPQLVKEKKYVEAYRLAEPFHIEELQKVMAKAKKQIDKNFKKLKKWYKSGKYERVIKNGKKQIDYDCRIKTLIAKSESAQETRNKNKKISRTIKKTSNLIDRRRYEKAIKMVNEFEFSNHPRLQALVKRAQSKLKKSKEKKILRKLRNIPSAQIEANLREYTNLLELFPDNKKYKQKLAHYKQQFLELGKKPPLPISKDEYEQWPFTVSKGELECIPPGKVTFKTGDKVYAISELAIVTGNNLKIDDILQDNLTMEDIDIIAKKGLDLCSK